MDMFETVGILLVLFVRCCGYQRHIFIYLLRDDCNAAMVLMTGRDILWSSMSDGVAHVPL